MAYDPLLAKRVVYLAKSGKDALNVALSQDHQDADLQAAIKQWRAGDTDWLPPGETTRLVATWGLVDHTGDFDRTYRLALRDVVKSGNESYLCQLLAAVRKAFVAVAKRSLRQYEMSQRDLGDTLELDKAILELADAVGPVTRQDVLDSEKIVRLTLFDDGLLRLTEKRGKTVIILAPGKWVSAQDIAKSGKPTLASLKRYSRGKGAVRQEYAHDGLRYTICHDSKDQTWFQEVEEGGLSARMYLRETVKVGREPL